MHVSPSMIAGFTHPTNGKQISPEATDLINRLRDHYRAQGKVSAAHNYGRHLKSFFAWSEGLGYTIHNLPTDAVESFLATLGAAGQKESTLYVMRTQLKAALREAANSLGADFHHLEFQTGKPVEVRKAQKQKEKQQRAEKRLVVTAQKLQAIQAAQTAMFGAPVTQTPVTTPVMTYGAVTDQIDVSAPVNEPETPELFQEETPMSDQSAPQTGGTTMAGVPTQTPSTQPIVINMPSQPQRPLASLGHTTAQQNKVNAPQPQRGVVLNNHTFNGPYIRIAYIADGSSIIPAGSEVALRVYPASQLAPHGDIATFLQSYVIPEMRLSPTVAQVQFVFHELNDKKQPTGRRDEMIVSVPAAVGGGAVAPAPMQVMPMGQNHTMATYTPALAGGDGMTNYLIQKLDREAEEAKKRAEALQEEMKKASDAQTTFLLMQQFQKEQELRREIEERRSREFDRALSPPVAPAPAPLMPPMPFPPMPAVEPVRDNSAAEIAKANVEAQKSLMEMMVAVMNRPQPVAPPQKDVAEWLIPFIAQMNQQAQAQAQAQQQMMMQQAQQSMQFMQAMLTKENPIEKMLMLQLQEVKAAANAPKADELESFADKLQKMKMVSDMLGGNSGPGFLSELLANADTIGAGAAKVIAAAKTQTPSGLNGLKAPSATTPALPASTHPSESVTVPAEAIEQLESVVAGLEAEDDQQVVNGVIEYLKVLIAQPENTPFPVIGQRLLGAFRNAEDTDELYTFVKNLWKQIGASYEKANVKAVSKVLAHWYSEIHEQLFGTPRELDGSGEEAEGEGEGETVETEATDVGEETAA